MKHGGSGRGVRSQGTPRRPPAPSPWTRACRTGASRPIRVTSTAQRRPGHRGPPVRPPGHPRSGPRRRGRPGQGEPVSAFEGLERPAGHRHRSVRQTRTQPRRGRPAHRSCANPQARGAVATDSGHADTPGLQASGRARDDRATAFSAPNPDRRAPPPGSSAAQARHQPPDAPTFTPPGRAHPRAREPLPRRLSHIADNAHYVK